MGQRYTPAHTHDMRMLSDNKLTTRKDVDEGEEIVKRIKICHVRVNILWSRI